MGKIRFLKDSANLKAESYFFYESNELRRKGGEKLKRV